MSYAPSPFTPMGSRNIQEQRDRWERKRSRTARELVHSEQRYCEQLDLVVTVSLSTGPTLHTRPWAELAILLSNNTLMEKHLSGLDSVILESSNRIMHSLQCVEH